MNCWIKFLIVLISFWWLYWRTTLTHISFHIWYVFMCSEFGGRNIWNHSVVLNVLNFIVKISQDWQSRLPRILVFDISWQIHFLLLDFSNGITACYISNCISILTVYQRSGLLIVFITINHQHSGQCKSYILKYNIKKSI